MFSKAFVLSFALVVSQPLFAQEALQRRPVPDVAVKPVPCPHPYARTLTGGSGASTPVLSEFPATYHAAIAGSTWNQTQTDKHFAHTFRFPSPGECCIATGATLRVTIKALNSGQPGGSAANNDAVHVFSGGAVVPGLSQQPWLTSGVSAGTVTTVTFQIPANVLATGMVSFYVQDDTAVQSAQLELTGCCLRKQK